MDGPVICDHYPPMWIYDRRVEQRFLDSLDPQPLLVIHGKLWGRRRTDNLRTRQVTYDPSL